MFENELRRRSPAPAGSRKKSSDGKSGAKASTAVFKRIKGSVKTANHAGILVNYITDKQIGNVIDEAGSVLSVQEAKEKAAAIAKEAGGKIIAHHLIFSGQTNNLDAIKKAAQSALDKKAHGHQYLIAIHEGKNGCNHAHVVFFAKNDFTDKQIDFKKPLLESMRGEFAEHLTRAGYPHKAVRRIEDEQVQTDRPRNLPAYYAKIKEVSRDEEDFQSRIDALTNAPKDQKRAIRAAIMRPTFKAENPAAPRNYEKINKNFMNYRKMREVAFSDKDYEMRCAFMKKILESKRINPHEKRQITTQLVSWKTPPYQSIQNILKNDNYRKSQAHESEHYKQHIERGGGGKQGSNSPAGIS